MAHNSIITFYWTLKQMVAITNFAKEPNKEKKKRLNQLLGMYKKFILFEQNFCFSLNFYR